MYNNNTWENATITRVNSDWNPITYKASLDSPAGHSITELLLNASQIRVRGARPNINFKVGDRVDAYYASGAPKGRATILEVQPNGRFKVGYDGCKSYWDESVDWGQLKPASPLPATHADVKYLIGKWAMFTPSYPNTVIKGNDIYREYGTGAKSPPLQINADGTYTWFYEYNKPPSKGRWEAHAKIEGMTMGTESVNGVLIKDTNGVLWKIYKRSNEADKIEARQMCSGLTQMGTRIK